MSKEITLRVIGFTRKSGYHFLCLDTDIAVRGDSIEDTKRKMVDALRSYFETFTEEEMERGKFIRYSPFRYRVLWRVGMFAGFLRRLMQTFNTTYDPHSGQLRFA